MSEHSLSFWATSALASLLVLSACSQGPTVTASVAAAQRGSAPAGTAASGASDWDNVAAAAKREGKVTVIGPVGDQLNALLAGPEVEGQAAGG